ncbi:MAG TPA: sigma-70 family RNA polymerase sigma factor [Planctomycetota bacterium]|nr:sigma-70 family RNA polymerase sigma factor [Planctomycetota bacterium]
MSDRGDADLLARMAELSGEPRVVPPAGLDLARDDHVDELAGQLLRRFRETDDAVAFELLVRLTEGRLAALARRMARELRPGVEPEDLVAAFFARLFTDVRRGQPLVRNFLGLARIALRNDALNQLRRRKRAEARQRAWHELRAGEPEPDPIRLADDREQAQRLERLGALVLALVAGRLAELPERDRLVLQAREIEGLSYEDIAVTFGVPRGQVGMVILRARKRLTARLRETFGDPAPPAPRRRGGLP